MVWYDNQVPELMGAFADLGCAFAFTFPRGMKPGYPMFLVEGKPEFNSQIKSGHVSDFFGNFSKKYVLLSDEPGSFRQQVEQNLLRKIKQECSECGSYEMKLFLSYPLYAHVLDEARTFSAARGLDLEKDVARVKWMLKKWGGDYRLQVVSVESFDGVKFATDD